MSEKAEHGRNEEAERAQESDLAGPGPQALPSPETLARLIDARMPFGKYQGRRLLELPEAYLLWFQRQGFPRGSLGEHMRWVLELKANGLMPVLNPLLQAARQKSNKASPK